MTAFIEPESLSTLRRGRLFYPCAGSDWKEFLRLFKKHIGEFHFADIRYNFDDRCARVFSPRSKFGLIGAELIGPAVAEMEWRWTRSGRRRSYRFLEPGKLIEFYERQPDKRQICVIRRRGFGQYALAEFADRSIDVFVHRGDSIGEGGSNVWWFSNIDWLDHEPCRNLFDKLSQKLADRALVITDGSNNRHPILGHVGQCSLDRRRMTGPQLFEMLRRHFFSFGDFDWSCVGFAGRRYGPTLVWQITRRKKLLCANRMGKVFNRPSRGEHPLIRTSRTDPLRIAELCLGESRGRIGITFAPGKWQHDAVTGPWERDSAVDLDRIAEWNAAAIVTLLEEHEISSLRIADIGERVRERHMEWHHWPIADGSVPDAHFENMWRERSRRLRSLIECGSNVLVHCKGGLGRAGMIAARLLADFGVEPQRAIDRVREVRGPGAIETRQQELWVFSTPSDPGDIKGQESGASRIGAAEDRAIGALVGLAVGDALGTTLEFQRKPERAVLHDMIGGGPFDLQVGQWTDDTAMALALAESLSAHPDLDPGDLANRFVKWWRNGEYSCTGQCFDIGNTVAGALQRFLMRGEALAGSDDPTTAGNGALMRLSPVAIRHWRDRSRLARVAVFQTRVTHGAREAIDASALFADILADAIEGKPIEAVLSTYRGGYPGRIGEIAQGAWRGRHRDDIRGSGYVVHALEAALWAVSRSSDFRSAVLLAANLGEDADTTAAITGQLAGAIYGCSGIPTEWIGRLAWRAEIERSARVLFDASVGEKIHA